MRSPKFDRLVAGTALALVFALPGAISAFAQEPSATSIESRIPVPEDAGVPPITLKDIEPQPAPVVSEAPAPAVTAAPAVVPDAPAAKAAQASAPTMDEAEILSSIPVPEAANVPPPSLKDVADLVDAPLAEKLEEFLTGNKADRLISGKKERAAIASFYKDRSYAPFWFDAGVPNARAKAAAARLRGAEADGLDPSDYALPDLGKVGKDVEALADAELRFSSAVAAFARHAQVGRVTSSRISPNIEFNPVAPDADDVLAKLAAATDVAATLDSYNPPHAGFKALKAKLAELRGRTGADTEVLQIPAGKLLRLQKKVMEDARVPLLRQRLDIEGDKTSEAYDATVAAAVRAFQKEKGIAVNGVLGPNTIAAMNGRSRSRDIDTIVSNMERWRWLPRDLGRAYVMVNVPDFSLKVVRNGSAVFRTKIVVGKAATPSPSFSAKIENIQVNPTWHVPESIIYGEYLPALQQDPSALSRLGLVMDRRPDGTVSIRQPPSERNALGRIKFNFPNRFQVYLHDTPDKKLFEHTRRAYSHGCMRVQNPTAFGEALASIALPQEGYTSERFTRMFGSQEQWIKFKAPVPVHLTYMNAFVDEAGKLVVREDIYGYDRRVQSALQGQYMAFNERSQRVVPGAARTAAGNRASSRPQQAQQLPPGRRQMVQDQERGFFRFPFFRE